MPRSGSEAQPPKSMGIFREGSALPHIRRHSRESAGSSDDIMGPQPSTRRLFWANIREYYLILPQALSPKRISIREFSELEC